MIVVVDGGMARGVMRWGLAGGVRLVTLRVRRVSGGGVVLAVQVVPVRVGGVDLLVEAVAVAGTEPMSRVGDAARGVVDAFAVAEEAIGAVCERVAGVVSLTASHVSKPSSLVVEFGLKFSAKGNVIVAGASGEAALKVTVSYGPSGQG